MQTPAKPILIRCYARKVEGQWVGVCLNFTLAAQADTFEQVKRKLHDQIKAYIHDATKGRDRAHRQYLLSRRAPLRDHLIYAGIYAMTRVVHFIDRGREHFAQWVEKKTLIPC